MSKQADEAARSDAFPLEGGCDCRTIRYRMTARPLVVRCCHFRSCQRIHRCPRCRIALWRNHSGAGPRVHFVRVGTLDTPDALPPDIHIFTASQQPRVQLPAGVPAVPEYHDRRRYWPAGSLRRREDLLRAE